jgi:hypothetical protein
VTFPALQLDLPVSLLREAFKFQQVVYFLRYTIIILSFHPCFDTDVQIILGDRQIDSNDLERIKKAAVIIGNRIVTYWKRPNRQGTIITAVSRGAVIDHDWRPDLQEKVKAHAYDFSKAAGLNLAAIDFVFPFSEEDPEPLFLEVNYYFARRGLGGTLGYYRLLYQAIRDWMAEAGLDPKSVRLG